MDFPLIILFFEAGCTSYKKASKEKLLISQSIGITVIKTRVAIPTPADILVGI